jgi:hypothetical protein
MNKTTKIESKYNRTDRVSPEVQRSIPNDANNNVPAFELKQNNSYIKMCRLFKSFLLLLCLGFCEAVSSQEVALKTNLLMDATLSPNVGIEFGLAPRWTMDVTGQLNAWTLSHDRKWKHWYVQPEARYWFCDRFAGHFIALHAFGGQYYVGNLENSIDFLGTDFSKISDNRFQGWFVGAGIAYGYDWVLSKHWNLEAEIGVGYAYSRYDKFDCKNCGQKVADDKEHHYFGPTKAAINLVYVF